MISLSGRKFTQNVIQYSELSVLHQLLLLITLLYILYGISSTESF